MYDLVIEAGTIVDGSGAKSFTGSVYLQDGRIASIKAEDKASLPAAQCLHARGKIVAPLSVAPQWVSVPMPKQLTPPIWKR